jgi:hypothetical protein
VCYIQYFCFSFLGYAHIVFGFCKYMFLVVPKDIDLCMQEIAEMDVDDILAKQVEQLEKERREMQERLKVQEKKVIDNIVCCK